MRKTLFAIVASLAMTAPLAAAEPPHTTFAPKPPGTIVQSRLAYLMGDGMQSQWRAVLSRKAVGKNNNEPAYQYYISIYQIDYNTATYHLRYQSPLNGGPLDKVEKPASSPLWFPLQTAKLIGVGQLMHPGVDEVVMLSHQTGADCGSADLTVFGATSKGKVVPEVTVQNGCALDVKIVKKGNLDVLQLSGPYYGPKAAMCCPTKPKASATLQFVNGKWVETPNYYKFFVKAFPHY